ncbi:MAG TPA: MmcQ/YjbR family DNA-binding protein [Dermatophilaceae bacterium]|nr:MmcQ/YjbR family DNA-binding protein [Dermatophilaceae bacterium]
MRRVCLSMGGVTERESWGRPAWFARALVARIWDDGVLTVKTDEREALVAQDPDTYFWTPHHDRSPLLLLVRMDRIDEQTLEELLIESHRLAS